MDVDKAPDSGQTRGERLRTGSRERRDQQKQELREAILTAAADLFLEQGYDRFSLRQVAERIGYSPTTIYLYFENKDDLLFQVVYEGFRRFNEEMLEALNSSEDPLERLRTAGRVYIRFGLANPAYYQLMFVERTDFLQHERSKGEGKPSDLLIKLEEAVQEAIDAGVLRPGDPAAYADAMWAGTHGVVTLGNCAPMFDDDRRQRAIDAMLTMIFEGLRTH
ncbi:MAG: TetR/AcrR family transcriptional regulator [Chloroflexota bacterium]